jgi:Flp pilus assembly pilin Flp
MKEMFRYLRMKLQENKGEVSVEWVLVAVIMAIIIVGVFNPAVSNMLTNAITAISTQISGAS